MNNFKNIFALNLSQNVPPTHLVLRASCQDERFFRTKYLKSTLLKKVKSDPLVTKPNCHVKKYQTILSPGSEKSKKHFSTKTETVFGAPRNKRLLEGNVVLDDGVHLNSCGGTTIQVAKFKSFIDNRLNKSEKGTETKKSSKANESKSSSQTFDQEAHSYAKLIANYSRAMETDAFHTRSFDKSFGKSNMFFNSSFERVVSTFSQVKDKKEAKIGSNFGRSTSAPSPKHRRDLQTDGDKNGRSSFYSTDSGKHDWMKKVDMALDELKKSRIDKSKNLKNNVKLEEKDALDGVEQQADWLDKVVTAYKKLKARETIPKSEIAKSDQVKRTMDLGKEELQSKTVSKKIPVVPEDSIIDSFIQNTPSPIELSFAPVIDTIVYPNEMVSSIEKENLIEAETKSSSKIGKLVEKSDDLPNSTKNNRDDSNNIFHEKNGNKGFGKNSMNDSKNSESSSLLDNIELRINGKPSSELESVIIKNDEINIVSSTVDKIEIRIPVSSLLDEKKNSNEDAKKLQRSSSTIKLQISAKIEDKHMVSKDEAKSEFKRNQVKVEPKKEVKIVLSSPQRRSIKGYDLGKTGNETSDFPWRIKTEPENKSQVLNFPSEVKEEDIRKKTNLTKPEKSLSLSSKKLSQPAVSAGSDDQTLQTSVVTPKAVSGNSEASAKSEKIVKDSPIEDHEKVKIQKNKEVDDKVVKKLMATNLNLQINKIKPRKRRKGTTVISRVIENELMKKNEQIVLKEKKVTRLTTEPEKNPPLAGALKPETPMDQNTATIDKVTKTDEVTDQHVKKLSESVTVAKDESKKVLDPSTSELLKIKQKDLAAKESPKKAIATSVTESRLPEIKSESEASETRLLSEKPHTVLNSQTKPLTSLPNISNTAKKDESQAQKSEIEVYKPKTVSGSSNKVNLNKDGPTFVEKARKTEAIESKDIPKELKPIEKKKDGTLIDYGLKVPSRKSLSKDLRKSTTKEEPIIKGRIKEIIPKKEESLVSGNEKNEGSKTFANALQKNSLNEQNKNNSLKGIPPAAAEITSPIPKEESLKLKSSQIIQGEKSSETPLAKAEESLIAESISKVKTTVFIASLKLLEFEENHIFSGPDRHLSTKDS